MIIEEAYFVLYIESKCNLVRVCHGYTKLRDSREGLSTTTGSEDASEKDEGQDDTSNHDIREENEEDTDRIVNRSVWTVILEGTLKARDD